MQVSLDNEIPMSVFLSRSVSCVVCVFAISLHSWLSQKEYALGNAAEVGKGETE